MSSKIYRIWQDHADGKSEIGDMGAMLADLHERTLRLEGKPKEADQFAAARKRLESNRRE